MTTTDPDTLRRLAVASLLVMASRDPLLWPSADPLRAVLPGADEQATPEQIAAVNAALAPHGLPIPVGTSGTPLRVNVAYLRSQLRRWAARHTVLPRQPDQPSQPPRTES